MPERVGSSEGLAADHAARDSGPTTAQRGRVIRMIVTTGVDHERTIEDVCELQPWREYRIGGIAVACNIQRRQVAEVPLAPGFAVLLRSLWVEVASRGKSRHRHAEERTRYRLLGSEERAIATAPASPCFRFGVTSSGIFLSELPVPVPYGQPP